MVFEHSKFGKLAGGSWIPGGVKTEIMPQRHLATELLGIFFGVFCAIN